MHCRLCCWLVAGLAVCLMTQRSGAAPKRTPRPPAARTWSDASGQYKIKATYVELADERVRLRKSDGSEISVPVDKLCKADRDWLARNAARSASAGATAVEWPGWRGPNRDGKSPDKGLLKQWPEGGPKLAWKISDLGQGYSSVAVVGGTIYATGQMSDGLYLHAFDLDGKRKWRVVASPPWTANYPGARATPTIDGGLVYLLSGTGLLGCYDAQTGRQRWAVDAKQFGGRPGGWGYAESVLIWQDLAIFKPGGANCIVALDKNNGRPVWSSQGFAAGPEYSSCLAVEHDGMPLLVTGTREGIVCVNLKRGSLLWANRFASNNTANCPTPAYSDGYVFWANGYNKGGICLRLGSGGQASEAWTTADMNCHHGGYVIHEGYIYGNNSNGFACLELKTGRKMWQERAVGKGSLCWADDMLYLFSEKGQAALATCSPDRLELHGRVQVEGDGPSWAHPVVIGGRLYLRYDTNLYAFDVKI
jgi:outer membrane protein assembly factor BamB